MKDRHSLLRCWKSSNKHKKIQWKTLFCVTLERKKRASIKSSNALRKSWLPLNSNLKYMHGWSKKLNIKFRELHLNEPRGNMAKEAVYTSDFKILCHFRLSTPHFFSFFHFFYGTSFFFIFGRNFHYFFFHFLTLMWQFYILPIGIPGLFSSAHTALVCVLGNKVYMQHYWLFVALLTIDNSTSLKILVHP